MAHDDLRDARYQRLHGSLWGGLPESRQRLHSWHIDLKEEIARLRVEAPHRERNPAVAALEREIENSGVLRMYVAEMIAQVPCENRVICDTEDLLDQLDHITRIAPQWEEEKGKRNFFPVSAVFTEMMMDPAGQAAFRFPPFNDAIRAILKSWCRFLDSEESRYVLNEGRHGWLSPAAAAFNKLDDFVIPDRDAPHWGWASYNAFFHREIKASVRPIAHPGDLKVIVSPNDGTVFRIMRDVKEATEFWIKSEPYSLRDMLSGSPYLDRFVDGHVFQSYLSGADYHRWHAPVDGTVRDAYVVDGLMFSNLVDDIKGIADQAYYTAVNTRGMTFIEADDPAIGMVCVMPVGITEVSSLTLTAQEGDRVRKGGPLGHFNYGGSSVAVLFERSAIARFTGPAPGQKVKVNEQIAVAT